MIRLTDKFDRAFLLASRVHRGQRRKGSEIPYISHLLAVCAIRGAPEVLISNLRGREMLLILNDCEHVVAACAELPTSGGPGHLLPRFAALAEAGDIPALFAALVDDTGILRREVFADAGERVLTNLTHVLEILLVEWARSHASLPELVDVLGAYVRQFRTTHEYTVIVSAGDLIGARSQRVCGGTFHSVANLLLRRYGRCLFATDSWRNSNLQWSCKHSF